MNVQRYFSLELATDILNGGVGMMIYLEVPNPKPQPKLKPKLKTCSGFYALPPEPCTLLNLCNANCGSRHLWHGWHC